MIDLEAALAVLVERAPEPPEVAGVVRRAKQRRRRRRAAALATAVVVLAAGIGVATNLPSSKHTSHVSVLDPATETVRITMLDGSQLEISGPPALGLTTLAPAFNGSLGPASDPQRGTLGHGFSVGHVAPSGLGGAVVGRFPTHDGHELVVHTTANGVDAVVRYGDWWLDSSWGTSPPAQWTAFASELNAKQTVDGFLVIEPTDPSWKLGPADAPDVQLGGDADGNGAALAFFGPAIYPAGCPAADTTARTAQGWPVSYRNGTWWCDADAKVRVGVWDPALVDAAVQGLRVAYTPANQAVDRITTLDGKTFEITAPSPVLDRLTVQSAVYVEGLDRPNLLNETPNLLPVQASRGGLPGTASSMSYPTADGHRFFNYVPPTACECEMLAATYGEWLVEIEVTGMSGAPRTLIASLFAAHQNGDGFLVLDPVAPMRAGPGAGSDIVLDGVDLVVTRTGDCPPPLSTEAHTADGIPVHVIGDTAIWCDPSSLVTITAPETMIDQIHVAPTPRQTGF
jgi:hypothetical protein